MIGFKFTPWKNFTARRNKMRDRAFLVEAGDVAKETFRSGMLGGHSGRHYPNLPNRSSAPGEYPANQFGPLLSSLKHEVTANEMVIGTNTFYAKFLREGTSKMARRHMSDDALKEAVPRARSLLKGWVEFKR